MTDAVQDAAETEVPVVHDLFDAAFIEEPYARLAAVRDLAPLVRYGNVGWLVTRHRDVSAILKSPKFGRDFGQWRGAALVGALRTRYGIDPLVSRWLQSIDPPHHTRVRRWVGAPLSRARVEQARALFIAEADAILTGRAGAVEVMTDVAYPYVLSVFGQLLGIPSSEMEPIAAWAQALEVIIEPAVGPDAMRDAGAAAGRLDTELRRLIASPERLDDQGVLASLISTIDTSGVDLDDAVATLALLLVAGFDTTARLIGNGVLALIEQPAALDALRAEPEVAPSLVDELLRFTGPGLIDARIAKETVVLHGQTLQPGDVVLNLLGAANRDPAVFDAPDVVDARRRPNPHVAFGGGLHTCLGAHLASLQAEAFYLALTRHVTSIELDGRPTWSPRVNVRGLSALPVRLQGG